MKIAVLGAGAWGTAVAISAATHPHPSHHVTLWTRDAAQAQHMQAQRNNDRYLPNIVLPSDVRIATGRVESLARASDLVIVATPMAGLREMLSALRHNTSPVVWLSKGFESPVARHTEKAGLLGHEIGMECAPTLSIGTFSGPSFAKEVALGQPTALVAASTDAQVQKLMVQALHSPVMRVYANSDVVGVEVGGAVKNVLAIATGLCDGLQLGLNARAALITRGLAEITRLGLALGAQAETFMGLSGLGDLVLTATGDLSRNRKVGLLLAQGCNLAQAVGSLGHVAEGVYCAHTVVQRARALGVEMPISQAVVDLLDGKLSHHQAVSRLMEREPRGECL